MSGRVTALVGGQYGSEGKGAVAEFLANEYSVHVRTGGPNAGHTIYYNGERIAMQVIPCGWVNPNARLVLGRGMLIDIDTLIKEIHMISKFDSNIMERIVIDSNCGVLSDKHQMSEGGRNGILNQKIGSTGKGVGAARIDRIRRDENDFELFEKAIIKDDRYKFLRNLIYYDTPEMLDGFLYQGDDILLEGTQGSGLSLIHGPWPFVTSADTNAAQLLSDAGIAPNRLTETIMVCRTFPIRVAGNSGPLNNELSWASVSAMAGRKVEEKTTVTNKTRRIGMWDKELVFKACILNNPDYIVLTFLDYMFPECEGVAEYCKLSDRAKDFIHQISQETSIPVAMAGTGYSEKLETIAMVDMRG